ncbi:MAG TPA: ATP synthase F1 subunit epsilon [bacterium]|nr:ATP synthase F1 subunit epsilon [bacterium]
MSSEQTIKFEVATPERVVYRNQVRQITLPAIEGDITVLPNHIPLVSLLRPGVAMLKMLDGQTEYLAIQGGFVEISVNKVVVLADTAEMASEINPEIVAAARAEAERIMADQLENTPEFIEARAQLAREILRLKAAELQHRHK